jgi:cyclohexanone monooxygenase
MSDRSRDPSAAAPDVVDVVVVGAGLAGLYMLYRLRGLGMSARAFEAGGGVGGTWYWNRYPGARCDVESMEYSYSFSDELQQHWEWSERYAAQPEILRYINHVADRFDLRRDVQCATRVTAAVWDEATSRWTIRTDRGDRVSARFCIMATGCLSSAQAPPFPGLDTFQGHWYHTGHWPHAGVDFTGQRVGVVGTGSSAIQSIPIIARQAAHLYVFQRTPNFSVPAHNGPLDPNVVRRWKAEYPALRRQARESRVGLLLERKEESALEVSAEARRQEYQARWDRGGLGFTAAFADVLTNRAANDTAAEFIRDRIRDIVRDPAVADALLPRDYPAGTKRMCVDTDYYATFNRANVTLVDVRRAPIEAITPGGLRTRDAEYALDSIVFAIGFDAMTGALRAIDIRGRGGRTLGETWAAGPRAYLGLAIAGFPNLFTITGPGSPSVLSNMIVSIEQHVDWIADCLAHLRAAGAATIEATPAAEAAWAAHVADVGHATLYPAANSWYMGANIPGKPRVFMPYVGGVGAYRQRCQAVADNGYEGFTMGGGAS